MNVNQKKLDEEIARQLGILKTLSPEKGEYEKAVDGMVKLYKLRIEEEKNENDFKINANKLDVDKAKIEQDSKANDSKIACEADKLAFEADKHNWEATFAENQAAVAAEDKEKEAKERKFDRWLHFGLDTAGIVVPLIFYGVWMNRGLKFEKDGTFTSTTFKNLIHFFKPTKKQ